MNKKNLKKAVVDQIFLWIVLFTIFVGFLFFIIDYSNTMKVKDNTDAIADYIGRMVALNKNEADIIEGINRVKDDYFADVSSSNLSCVANNSISNYQVVVNVYTTLTNSFIPVAQNNIHSKTVVFNENSEFEKECILTLSFN